MEKEEALYIKLADEKYVDDIKSMLSKYNLKIRCSFSDRVSVDGKRSDCVRLMNDNKEKVNGISEVQTFSF